jgi:hypothetical protein
MPNRIQNPGVRPAAVVQRPAARPVQADATAVAPQGWQPRTPAQPPPPPREFNKSADGTPIFKQGDGEWGRTRLGKGGSTIGRSGCAMTCVAMALSKLTGETITPKALDAWLDKNRGYSGDALDWSRAGKMKDVSVTQKPWSLSSLDAQLDAGRPVIVGVDYKKGSNGGAGGTDHWVLVTAKTTGADGKTQYLANDPGTGKQISLSLDAKGRLVGTGADALGQYKTTGQMRVVE